MAKRRAVRNSKTAQQSRKAATRSTKVVAKSLRGLNGAANHQPAWTRLSDSELLDVRICDLGVRLEGTVLETRVQRMYDELAARNICFRPHCWLSDDWFSPDGVPGIGIPFYMAHPRLTRLERNQMFEVEGGTQEWCMRILRHEAGHSMDTAYRLGRRRRWQDAFGKPSKPYPEHYQPKMYSKSYVQHLEAWYAQSHPAEDFAETFAVWLRPRSRWRVQYANWPALHKLEYVDELMDEIQDTKPKFVCRERVDPVRKIRKTLREHYSEKRERYCVGGDTFYDHDLRRLFSDSPECARNGSAAAFLRRSRKELRQVVAEWTGQYQYTIDQVLSEMIERCRALRLRLDRPEQTAKRDAQLMLTVQTMNFLHRGRNKIAL